MKSYVVKTKYSRFATAADGVETATVRFAVGQKLALSDEDAAPLLAAGRIALEADADAVEKPRKVTYGRPHDNAPASDPTGETGGLQIPAGNAAVAAAGGAKVRIPSKPKNADEA